MLTVATDMEPSDQYQSPSTVRRHSNKIKEPPVYPIPKDRSAKSAFDPDHHRLFITRGESVDVFDVTTKKITGSISRTSGVHGVALAPELGRGFQ